MKRKTYLIIVSAATFLILAAAVVGVVLIRLPQFEQVKDTIILLIKLLIIPILGVGIFGFIFNRCHGCGRFLQQLPFYAKNCPYCGKKFDEE